MDPIVTTARMGFARKQEGIVHGNVAGNPVPDQFNGQMADFVVPGSQAYFTCFGMVPDEMGVLHGKGYFAIIDGQGHLVFEDKDCAYSVTPGEPDGDFPTIANLTATGIENRTGFAYALRTEGIDENSVQRDLIVTLGRDDKAGRLMQVLLWAQHA